jgi:DNA-binding response OmpR family regulator
MDGEMNKRLMVVDDDPDILISVRKIFENEGYEVLTVDSGIDCLKELERGFNGVIFMDIMMPFIDGRETNEEIFKRVLDKSVIITILTAKGTSNHEKMRGLESLIHDYISKPFNIKELITNVEQMIAM